VLALDNDIYEEVVKPLLENSKLDVELGFFIQPPAYSPLEKRT
jgi:hypothetical protein